MAGNDSFKDFGRKFQSCVLKALLSDRIFFEDIFEILKEDYFSSNPHKMIWVEICKLYQQYQDVPTFDVLKIEIANYPEGEIKDDTLTMLVDIKSRNNKYELQYAKDKSLEFCRNQSMKGAIIKSIDLLKDNKFDEIQRTVEEALKISSKTNLGHDYFKDLKYRAVKEKRDPIPTGKDALDQRDILDGGLAAGEIGLIMAPTGVGKSHFLVDIGYGALAAGYNVVHYSFELSEKNIGLRYDSRITQISTKKLYDRLQEWEERINMFKGGELVIKEYPTKTATVNTLKFHISRLMADGFDPDVIIIDYGDLMKSRRGYDQKRFELEAIFEDLRGFSMEIQKPIWTATQTNRDGFNDDIITIDKIGEAIGKAQIVDFFGTFSMNYFHVGKNRMGRANLEFAIEIDYERSIFDMGSDVVKAQKKKKPFGDIMQDDSVTEKTRGIWQKFRDERE